MHVHKDKYLDTHAILQSVVGGPGPLIVEHKGQIFIEHCMMITDKHVNRLKDIILT